MCENGAPEGEQTWPSGSALDKGGRNDSSPGELPALSEIKETELRKNHLPARSDSSPEPDDLPAIAF